MWKKLGRVYKPVGTGWRKSHGFTPSPLVMEDKIRVYAGFWGEDSKCRLGYVDVEKDNPMKIINISENPVIELGEPGSFDSDAMIPSQAYMTADGRVLLAYTGWQNLDSKMKRLAFSGIVTSIDGGNIFQRHRRTPFLDRTDDEPYMRTMPVFVDGNVIYLGANEYHIINGWYVPKYSVKCISDDFTKTILDVPKGCLGIARPTIVRVINKDSEILGYDMWVSVREFNIGYKKIVHAYSPIANGTYEFTNDKDLVTSNEGWDSEMVCFPYVFSVEGKAYMLYCGNNYGETGFGVAEWIGD